MVIHKVSDALRRRRMAGYAQLVDQAHSVLRRPDERGLALWDDLFRWGTSCVLRPNLQVGENLRAPHLPEPVEGVPLLRWNCFVARRHRQHPRKDAPIT